MDRYIQSLDDVARFSERMIEHTFFYKREHFHILCTKESKSKTNIANISHVVMLFVAKNINFAMS